MCQRHCALRSGHSRLNRARTPACKPRWRAAKAHAGSTGSITLDVYSKTWWDERVDAVTAVVEAVFTEPEEKEGKTITTPLKDLPKNGDGADWVPFWVPQGVEPDQNSTDVIEKNGRGGQI